MRMSMLLGAMLGFLAGIAAGLSARNAWPLVLWHAAVAALLLGILARWWAAVWQSGLRQAVADRITKAEQQRKAAKTEQPAHKS